jgi:hypothetical protein
MTDITILYFFALSGLISLLIAMAWIYISDIDIISSAFTFVSAVAFYKAANMFLDGTVTSVQTITANNLTSQSIAVVQNTGASDLMQWVGIILFGFTVLQVYTVYGYNGGN